MPFETRQKIDGEGILILHKQLLIDRRVILAFK